MHVPRVQLDLRSNTEAVLLWSMQVSAMTNGSAESVAKPVLTAGGVMQLCKGPMLDINMPQVSNTRQPYRSGEGGCHQGRGFQHNAHCPEGGKPANYQAKCI